MEAISCKYIMYFQNIYRLCILLNSRTVVCLPRTYFKLIVSTFNVIQPNKYSWLTILSLTYKFKKNLTNKDQHLISTEDIIYVVTFNMAKLNDLKPLISCFDQKYKLRPINYR